jgi:hypothetical protein
LIQFSNLASETQQGATKLEEIIQITMDEVHIHLQHRCLSVKKYVLFMPDLSGVYMAINRAIKIG